MERIKWLDGDFKEVKHADDACYGIHEDGDVELYTPYDTSYPWLAREEVLKLAKILLDANDNITAFEKWREEAK